MTTQPEPQQTPTIREKWDSKVAALVAQGFPSAASANVALALSDPGLARQYQAEVLGVQSVSERGRIGTMPMLYIEGES